MKVSMVPYSILSVWQNWGELNKDNSLFMFLWSHLDIAYTDKCTCDTPKISAIGQMLKQCDDPEWVYRCAHCLSLHIYTKFSHFDSIRKSEFMEFVGHINERRGVLFNRCVCGLNLNSAIQNHYAGCGCNHLNTKIADLCGGCTFRIILDYNWHTLINMPMILDISKKKIGLAVV